MDATTVNHDGNCKALLQRITNGWNNRSGVRKPLLNEEISAYTLDTRADFLPELLPFSKHDLYKESSDKEKSKILSLAWIIYNQKGIAMESEIVTPVCNLLLKGKFPGVDKQVYTEVIAETLVDEAYHIMLSSIAINITRNKKGMQLLSLPEYALKKQMDFCCSKLTEEWQKNIIMLATAVVSELFISDYLNVLCGAKDIPDFNRQSVESHRRDEMVHNRIFDSVACVVCHNFSQKEKDFFASALPKSFKWFASLELDVWRVALKQIDVVNAEAMISDCFEANFGYTKSFDFFKILSLADRLDINKNIILDQASCFQ